MINKSMDNVNRMDLNNFRNNRKIRQNKSSNKILSISMGNRNIMNMNMNMCMINMNKINNRNQPNINYNINENNNNKKKIINNKKRIIKDIINKNGTQNKNKTMKNNCEIHLDNININNINKNENINENINIGNKNEKKDEKIEHINNNQNNIPLIYKEEKDEKLNERNPFFLNHKRKRNLSINEKEIMNVDPINIFINAILERRKRLYNNTTLLNDSQLIFLITKIEKTIPEFRYLNLKIHTDIIFNYDINYSLDNESNIIDEFYEKSKNKKNLIFLIKTKNDKTFGGFSELGFDRNNSIIFDDNYSFFVFSIDKMKIYDFVEDNENCVFGYSNKLPEFKNQLFFEDNNLKVGYTGNKKSGFLMNKDYELNDGNKMFYINQIQVISLYVDL